MQLKNKIWRVSVWLSGLCILYRERTRTCSYFVQTLENSKFVLNFPTSPFFSPNLESARNIHPRKNKKARISTVFSYFRFMRKRENRKILQSWKFHRRKRQISGMRKKLEEKLIWEDFSFFLVVSFFVLSFSLATLLLSPKFQFSLLTHFRYLSFSLFLKLYTLDYFMICSCSMTLTDTAATGITVASSQVS